MIPEIERPIESQNKIGQVLQRYVGSEKFFQHARTNNTLNAYTADLSLFFSFCQNRAISSIEELKPDNISAWFEELKRRGDSSATLTRRRASLAGFLYWGIDNELVQKDVLSASMPNLQESYIRRSTKSLTKEQIDALLKEAKKQDSLRDAAFILIAVQTGVFVEKIADLNRCDVFQIDGQMGIRFYDEKEDEYDTKQVDKTAQEVIGKYLNERDVDPYQPLFPGERHNERITRQGLWFILKKYRAHVGVPELSPTMLRNTYFENKMKQKREST